MKEGIYLGKEQDEGVQNMDTFLFLFHRYSSIHVIMCYQIL